MLGNVRGSVGDDLDAVVSIVAGKELTAASRMELGLSHWGFSAWSALRPSWPACASGVPRRDGTEISANSARESTLSSAGTYSCHQYCRPIAEFVDLTLDLASCRKALLGRAEVLYATADQGVAPGDHEFGANWNSRDPEVYDLKATAGHENCLKTDPLFRLCRFDMAQISLGR